MSRLRSDLAPDPDHEDPSRLTDASRQIKVVGMTPLQENYVRQLSFLVGDCPKHGPLCLCYILTKVSKIIRRKEDLEDRLLRMISK